MERVREQWGRYRRWNYDKAWGYRSRKFFHKVSNKVLPYIQVIIPNFRAAHYAYILFWVFFGSVLIYPVKNMSYIDALFLAGGASTQAGLNTIDLNATSLYQQIVVFIVATLTTPIFIHGSILFVRLYAFERHFDDIKESSKLNFKMRRSATLAARTQSFDATHINTVNNQGLGMRANQWNNRKNENPHVSTSTSYAGTTQVPSKVTTDPADIDSILEDGATELGLPRLRSPSSLTQRNESSDSKLCHESEPSDSDLETPIPPENRHVQIAPEDPLSSPDHENENEGIRFGHLPQPSKRRQNDINPSDMYRSIAMLQDDHRSKKKSHNQYHGDDDDDEDVLVIRPPNEIENDRNPIYTRKVPQIQFNVGQKPTHKKWIAKRKAKRKHQWSKLKKTFSNSGPSGRRRRHTNDTQDINSGDDHSIDSEQEDEDDEDDDDDDEDDEDGDYDETAVVDDDDDEEEHCDDRNRVDDSEDEEEGIGKVQSHLVIPSSDATGGKKFGKRSNTLEITPGRKNSITKSPTFERMIRSKLKRGKHNKKHNIQRIRSGLRRNSSTPAFVSDFDDETEDHSFDSESEDDQHDGNSLGRVMSGNYLSWVPTVGRNSTFVHMTDEQKEELGGVEYRAVKLLIKILMAYYIGFHILSIIMLVPWIQGRLPYTEILRSDGVSPTWWAFFTAQSSFNDLGLTLTPNSMQSFYKSTFVLVVVSFFVIIGNTGFPVLLRFIIWILFKVSKPLSLFKESLGFLLDHPRRCFTLLFPSVPTWWLLFILVALNAVDLVLFIILDLKNEYLKDIPLGYRILNGLFQAFSTRTAGFSVVDLSQLHPAVQVSYMLMMYISVLPLAISIRRTNVYEEQSLGVYLKDENQDQSGETESTPKSFVGAHLRNQLSFDLWFIFLGLFIICIAEGGKLDENNTKFTIFKVLFEIISAYGTVGLSLGYPGVNASFSYEFTTISKLVIIAMMVRGRHRGLPYALDRAIMLPDDAMKRRDLMQENHAIRRHMTDASEHEGEGGRLRRVISRRASTFGVDGNAMLNRIRSRLPTSSTFTGNYHPSAQTQGNVYQEPQQEERPTTYHPESSYEMNVRRPSNSN
ncbi:low-affinity potassium transport protein [[Candida] anglica]|uniref:Potassium transport protein n=1 Tax=[Candida] anglica TaxID=148631 RepID=A0ABP0E8I0_9ASCO